MTEVKRHVEIAGYGVCLPKQTVQFKNQTRYRVVEDEETQLDLAEVAIQRALENANLKIADIAKDGQLLQYVREIAERLLDDDPEGMKPENQIIWQQLKELRKKNVNWSVIS